MEKLRLKLEEFAYSAFYAMLHRAASESVKSDAFQNLPKEGTVDFFIDPHDGDMVLFYRHSGHS